MIHRPRIIFADEPTGLLDRNTVLQVIALLLNYCNQGSLIVVTHNPEILNEADLVIAIGTVKRHTVNIFNKLDVKNRTELVAKARGWG